MPAQRRRPARRDDAHFVTDSPAPRRKTAPPASVASFSGTKMAMDMGLRPIPSVGVPSRLPHLVMLPTVATAATTEETCSWPQRFIRARIFSQCQQTVFAASRGITTAVEGSKRIRTNRCTKDAARVPPHRPTCASRRTWQLLNRRAVHNIRAVTADPSASRTDIHARTSVRDSPTIRAVDPRVRVVRRRPGASRLIRPGLRARPGAPAPGSRRWGGRR